MLSIITQQFGSRRTSRRDPRLQFLQRNVWKGKEVAWRLVYDTEREKENRKQSKIVGRTLAIREQQQRKQTDHLFRKNTEGIELLWIHTVWNRKQKREGVLWKALE